MTEKEINERVYDVKLLDKFKVGESALWGRARHEFEIVRINRQKFTADLKRVSDGKMLYGASLCALQKIKIFNESESDGLKNDINDIYVRAYNLGLMHGYYFHADPVSAIRQLIKGEAFNDSIFLDFYTERIGRVDAMFAWRTGITDGLKYGRARREKVFETVDLVLTTIQ